jgi:anaerobic magnesium-protoporphyrin IX monomethyl ester cyclase
VNILLVNSNRFREPFPVVPLGLCAVASALQAGGHDVTVLDLCFARDPAADLRRYFKTRTPDLVGISIRNIDTASGYKPIFLMEQVRDDVVKPIQALFSGPIVVGGPAVGINSAQILTYLNLEYAIQGDGETSMLDLARCLATGRPISRIPGLVIQREGHLVEDNPPSQVDDLDELPLARPWQWVDLARYVRNGGSMQVQTKRGCALYCSYCSYNRIEGRSYRLRSPERVAEEIAELVTHTSQRHIELVDSAFNVPLNHAKEVLKAIAKRKLRLRLSIVGLHPMSVDEELVDLLCECGVKDVGFSVEAGSDGMLESLGKSFTTAHITEGARLLHQRKIPIQFFLLLGAPGETTATLAQTFETMERVAGPWDLVTIGIGIRIYQGSPLAERTAREHPALAANAFFEPNAYEPAGITLEQIKDYCRRQTATHANYLMYDEGDNSPPFLFRFVVGRLFPRMPLWKGYIAKKRKGLRRAKVESRA